MRTWFPAIAWMLLIVVASTDLMSAEHTSRFIAPILRWLRPGIAPGTVAAVQLAVRKAAHVTEYAVLAALVARAWHSSLKIWQWRHRFAVICFAGCYAALDEFHQSFVVSRTASARDVLIDAVGALVGVICYSLVVKRCARAADRSQRVA